MTDNRQITQEDIEECRRETNPLLRDLLNTIAFWHEREPSAAMLFCAQVAQRHVEDLSIAEPLLGQLVDMLRGSIDS